MGNSVIHGEWIGKDVLVLKAANKSLEGLKGLVVDETKQLIVLETTQGVKRIQKHLARFQIKWDGEQVNVNGDDLIASPEERIKRKVKQ